MTSRLHDQHELAVTANRFAAVFSALSDGVIVTDERGLVREANPVAHRLLRRARLVDTPLPELLPPGRAEIVERADGRVLRRWRVPVEEGEMVLDVVTTPTLDEAGNAAGAVHTVRDVTSQAQLLRLKEEFLFDVAHELRTPISSLTASLDLLHQDAASMPPRQLRSMLATLRRSALRLEAFVESLLDVGSIQAGTFEVRPTVTRLRRCVNDALFLTKPMTSGKRQTVRVRVARGCERVVADPRRTAQVLANLLANASKYSPEQSRIEVTGAPQEGFVLVSVRDEGAGIDQVERARVFDRFYRARIGRDTAGGIGLGLAICRAIVEAQGGEIGIDAGPSGGTIVHFTLPRPRAEDGR